MAIGELMAEREKAMAEHEDWVIDLWEALAAEVAAALRVSIAMGSSYLRYATAMRERLPKVGAVFEAGDIDYRLFQTIVFRTDLITDPDALANVDAQIAARAPRWPSMSKRKLAAAIDTIVAKVDPDAVRRAKEQLEDRWVSITDTEAGMAELTARLFDTTGKALDKRLDQLAATVCDADPRTRDQRRSDALEALVTGAERLGCRCGNSECPAGGMSGIKSAVVIHVVADQSALEGASDAPAVIAGGDALISAEVLRELAAAAKIMPVIGPRDDDPEPRYAPSRALADFVRCRDLTCRAPGCDHPAQDCDIDHTVPHAAGGHTHASNLKCVCRKHHLMKTFWGWRDEQLPDGTVIWTLPGGQRYVTTPGSALLFPSLCVPTGKLPKLAPRHRTPGANRGVMMPRRARSRAQTRAQAILNERRINHERRTARRRQAAGMVPPGTSIDPDDEPPF